MSPRGRPVGVALVLLALFLSGVAGVVNQVVWQRALKVFLGGSETISSMLVVLAFMAGLGIGAGLMGARVGRMAHPLRVFGLVELLLVLVNLGLMLLFSLDLAETVTGAQRLALSAGLPLRAVYGLGALVVLLPPTVLMGATLPAASEACQRQLGATRTSLITVLFFLNTIGAVVGAFGGSFLLLPYLGQRVALTSAAAFNLGAALLLLALATRVARTEPEAAALGRGPIRWRPRLEEALGLGLGLLALGYEMVLFRLMALAHEPLPHTFATTLCLYLLAWSVGVYLAPMLGRRPTASFLVGAVLTALVPSLYAHDRFSEGVALFGGGLLYFLPCVPFGVLYGVLVSRSAERWGSDVGRFYAFNTVGSCLGIALFTLVGYELSLELDAYLVAFGLLGLMAHWLACTGPAHARVGARLGRGLALGGLVALVALGLSRPYTESEEHGTRTYWGRDGVVEIDRRGDVVIDGLWHSRLSRSGNHVGRSYSWMMAVAALLTHPRTDVEEALVVGNGVGMTASTLALVEDVHVDAYEINRTLEDVLSDYERQTLGIASNPKVDVRWTDARSGLALDPKRYDVIVTAPLHLRQAGSGLLLSREYFELLSSRLEPDGVVALYAHEGEPEQALLVRRTAASVFEHTRSFDGGVLLVASHVPLDVSPARIAERLALGDPLWREVAAWDAKQRERGQPGIQARVDRPSLPATPGRHLITDDHPLVEYPAAARRLAPLSPD
jgi:spermidine synthase